MNIFKKCYCRTYQEIMWIATLAMNFRIPKTLEGEGVLSKMPDFIRENEPNVKRLLVVTDKGLMKAGLLEPMFKSFTEAGLEYTLYDGTVPNPTVDNIKEAVKLYKENNCQALVAFGGGSSMDCAKGIGAMVACPKKTMAQMRGVIKVNKKIPPFFAIPTTAGTGSETTVAAVISDGNYKYTVMDPVLVPLYAVLDPLVTVGLPKHVTSTTGMDALSHAVEAYTNKHNNNLTRTKALSAVKLIFENLQKAYDNGSDIEVRNNMQVAAYEAGIAFTRSNVGAIHAISHAFGGQYHLPHGLAIAITMPHVLRWYGKAAHKRLAELADVVGISGASNAEKAEKFISAIEQMNAYMQIPATISGNVKMKDETVIVKEEDIATMVNNAYKEAVPLYPLPALMDKADFEKLFREIAGI